MRQRLLQPDADGVGLPEILAQDVAQRDVEHRRRRDDLLLFLRVDGRVREEADHRLPARFASRFDLLLLAGVRKMDRDVFEL